jgi:pyridoxamine 5'-phosphate oxidase
LTDDPVALFNEWLEAARTAGVATPEAMTLATADAEGRPSARMLLLKGADERGFAFFSGYESRKGRELDANPRAALVVYWQPLGRQVRVEGRVRKLSAEESDAYWATRPPRSRAAAAASRQSEPIENRAELDSEFERLLPGDDVPRPARWGGYVLEPEAIELWQHRDDRLHERVRYTRSGERWRTQLLSP